MKPSDVVFMYAADRQYLEQYGATWIAWGGGGRIPGVHTTGSFWCLTAGPQLLHDDPALHEAVCRDIEGTPISPSWQLDNNYKGQPTWYGCTNNPAFREHLRKECLKAVTGRPGGLHIDDPAGSFGSTYAGGCYCESCMKAFREWLIRHDSPRLREEAGISSWNGFDYRGLIRRHTPTRKLYTNPESLPLRRAYLDFQVEAMVAGIRELGDLARSRLGPSMTLSVNTYYGEPASPNIAFVPAITHMVCEVEHHAPEGAARLMTPVGAYRQAEALGRPLAATASGSDWAWVKEHNAVNLVKVWIALSYACGQRLMVPHPTMQWCHTAEKGTHWYKAPPGEFTPLYRFVRENAGLLDGYLTAGPLAPPSGIPSAFTRQSDRDSLRKALAEGDPRPLSAGDGLLVFPRVKPTGEAVVHLVNTGYDPASDRVPPRRMVRVELPAGILQGSFRGATLRSFDAPPVELRMEGDQGAFLVAVPEVRTWAVLELAR
jgi:hypothetical protein